MIERTEGYLRVADGEDIWYETAGDGPPLVLCHGLGGNTAVWFQQVPHFADRYRVISWDQRGFGRSSNTALRHGPVAAVSDLRALLDHLEVERAAVIGQSMGGWAALGAALQEPDRVSALVLTSSTAGIRVGGPAAADNGEGHSRPGTDRPGRGGNDRPGRVEDPVRARPLGVHPAIGERLPALDPARAYLYQTLGTFGRRPPDSEFAQMLIDTTYDQASLAAMAQPALLVCGELDPLMTPGMVRAAASQLPHADVVELAGRGHSPYFEEPAEWNTAVDAFLRSEFPTR